MKLTNDIPIPTVTEYLANRCLENSDEYHNYSHLDLMNATMIFSHYLIDMIWKTNQEMRQEKREELAKTVGEAIRELIISSTGVDMHEVVKS